MNQRICLLYNYVKSNKYFSLFNKISFDLTKDLVSFTKMVWLAQVNFFLDIDSYFSLSRKKFTLSNRTFLYDKLRFLDNSNIIWLHEYQPMNLFILRFTTFLVDLIQ